MKVFNTMTREKEEFVPINEKEVKMYVCGPTVYDYIHIGNARPLVVFDTIRRYFEYKKYNVRYVQNFTDIDDKIIKKAIEQDVSSSYISNKYIDEALVDMNGLNLKPSINPKVTEEIDEIIVMISGLIEKGFAYEKNSSVYFNSNNFKEYGKLSKKNIEDLISGARVAVNDEKNSVADFVLWKPAKEGEPKWPSPWGEGRPGWHIECSVMSKKYLGETIDIHGGGEDLIFPHHENEIAQSEAMSGKPLAKYWMHNGFINVDNQKMSKSKGNFFTLREIVSEFTYEEVRFFILSCHYRSPLNFSHDLMIASRNGLNRIKTALDNIDFIMENTQNTEIQDNEKELIENSRIFIKEFENKMDNDFNTADAVAVIFEYIKFINTNINDLSSKELLLYLKNDILFLLDILGIVIKKEDNVLEEEIENLISERQTAKKNKDYNRADEIRDYLLEKGIVLEDTRMGVKWNYKN